MSTTIVSPLLRRTRSQKNAFSGLKNVSPKPHGLTEGVHLCERKRPPTSGSNNILTSKPLANVATAGMLRPPSLYTAS